MNQTNNYNEAHQEIEKAYMNKMQIRGNLIDSNVLIGEIARAGGKTSKLLIPRMIRVAFDMPGELSFLVHKTYTAAMTNMVPSIIAGFKEPMGENQEPMFQEGIDYIVGSSKIPNHFQKPLRSIPYPKHSILLRSGHHFQIVASDQPDSMAGQNGVHAFIEEMKHNSGQKIKSRIFPGLRGGTIQTKKSHLYEGITGITDTARVDMGEDNWYQEFEKNVNIELINEIATVAKHYNDAIVERMGYQRLLPKTKNPVEIKKLQKEIDKRLRIEKHWAPKLRRMRKPSTYYMRSSSFVNKDILGVGFFKTQFESLQIDEFLAAICNIAPKQVVNMFFGRFDRKIHTFSDSYKYDSILKYDLKDNFRLTAGYLKYFNPREPLILMYDPGHFSSLLVAQFNRKENELRILKEFYVWHPKDQSELASLMFNFFHADHSSRRIELYYDRAGNKRREIRQKITTDAKQLKSELEASGFKVRLKNEKQRTLFYYEHYQLALILLGERRNDTPRIRICENECPNLVSAIHLSPLRHTDDGRIELDKTSEDKVALPYQAGLTTQGPSALTYGLYGLFSNFLPKNMKSTPSLPDNISS